MKTRNKRSKRKTRKMRGGGILFDGVWKAEPGISGDRLAYSNSEASFLNVIRIGYLDNELTWYRNIDAVRDTFLTLDTGIMEATTPEEMRQAGYKDMLSVIGSLSNAVTRRALKDKDFETISTIVVIDDRGRETERIVTDTDKRNHRERTEALRELLKALNLAKKPYDDKYNSFSKKEKPENPERQKPTFSTLENDPGVDDVKTVDSLAPRIKNTPRETHSFEEQLAQAKEEQVRADQVEKEKAEKSHPVPKVHYCPGPGCSQPAEKQCSRCKSVKYCSAECQKQCWKEHKPFCVPIDSFSLPPLPPLDYVATLPFYVEDIRSLAFLHTDRFVCYAITKTQILNFMERYDVFTGPYVVEKKGEKIELKHDKYNRKTSAVIHAFKNGKIPTKELEEGLMQLVREANLEEKKTVRTDEEVEHIRTEGQKAKSMYTMIQKYKEKVDVLTRNIPVTNENMDTLITYLDSQKNPFIKSELSKLKVKYGSLQRTDALVQDIKTILIETQKLAQESVDTLLERVEEFYKVRRDLKRARELYETEKAKYKAFQEIKEYESLNEIGIPVHSPSGLVVIQNNVIVSMDHSMYDINRGFKIGGVEGCNDGTNLTGKMSQPTDMVSDGTIILCADSRNHSIVSYRIEKNKLDFITKNIPGYVNGKDVSTWRFNTPMGITFDEKGDIIIADTGNDCIRKMVLGKNSLTTIAGRQPGEATSMLRSPMSVCMFGDSIIVADTGNHCIRKLTKADGSYKMDVIAGTPGTAGYRNGRDSLFSSPCKVAVWNGNIYVADRGNNRIRMIVDHEPKPGEFPKNLIV